MKRNMMFGGPLILMGIVLGAILLNGCSKDPDPVTGHRVISEKFYGPVNGEGFYEYTGNKLTRVSHLTDLDEADEYIFEYPGEDSILVHFSAQLAFGNINKEYEIILENSRPVEITENSSRKSIITYNQDGQIQNVEESLYINNIWIMLREVSSQYSSGRVAEKFYTYFDKTQGVDRKYEYLYNGNEISEIIRYSKNEDSTWVKRAKDVYTYESGNISQILSYDYIVGTWRSDGHIMNFKYDDSGNLLESESLWETCPDCAEKLVYTYEKGRGNYRNFFGLADYWLQRYPLPL